MLDTERRSAPPKGASPYPGLVPYSEKDAFFFFGREQDRGIIAANLQASPLTVLYGASGVGKSSVLRAGVVHALRRQAEQQLAAGLTPESFVVEFATWRDDPIAGLADAIVRSVELTPPKPLPPPPPPTRQLDRLLGQWSERLGADLLIILDQFEEYFLYHGRDDGEDFGLQFPKAVNARDLRANFLVSIREDALAKLDLFKGQIPNLFGNYLRIQHLDRDAARDAITLPLRQYNELGGGRKPVAIEPELVAEVLEQVKTGQLVVGQVGRGGIVDSDRDGERIETPYLQLVMSRLWREEKASERQCVLRLATLERLGGAERIVRTHLDEAMEALTPDQASLAAGIFRFLVTRGGSKVAHTAADLADWAEVDERDVAAVLERLAQGDVRILRAVAPPPGEPAARFEIFHDVLASAVLDWRARYEQRRRQAEAEARLEDQRRTAEERARKARRRTRTLAGLLGAAVVAVGAVLWLALWALGQSSAARSEALVGRALSALSVDPRRSVRLALQAWEERNTRAAEAVLRQALPASRIERVVSGHDDIVWSAEFSPDGRRVVSASRDGTARITDVVSGATIALLEGHEDDVNAAAFAPDGRLVVTASLDGTARVWDAETGRLVHVFPHGGEPVPVFLANTDRFTEDDRYLSTGPFSPDGRYLVTSAGDSAWMWDLSTGDQRYRWEDPGGQVLSAAFSPTGRSIVTGGYEWVRVWDARTGEERDKAKVIGFGWVNQAVYSPDGDDVATAHSDGSIGIWREGAEVHTLYGHSGDVLSLSFSPDSTMLVSAGDKKGQVWNLEGPAPQFLGAIEGFASWINTVEFSPDGRYIVTANQDGIGRVWEAVSGKRLLLLPGHRDIVWTAQFSPDGDHVVTASEDSTARIWNVDTGAELRQDRVGILSAAFSHDGSLIVTAGGTRAVVWDPATGTRLRTIKSTSVVNSAEFDPVGDRVVLATGSSLLPVVFHDPRTGEFLGSCCEHEEGWQADYAAFSPVSGDERVVVRYRDSSVRIWDVSTEPAAVLQTFGGPKEPVITVSFGPDGRRILTVGRDDKVTRLWDSATGQEIGDGWRTGLASVAFSPIEPRVVTGGTDGIVRLWDIETGTQVGRPLRGSAGMVVSVAFSPRGRAIVAGGSDGSVRIWDAGNMRPLAVLRLHADGVSSVAVGPGGLIVSASDDRTAKIYECETCVGMTRLVTMAERHLARTDPRG